LIFCVKKITKKLQSNAKIMYNKKTGVIVFLFLLLIQITISINTFFKFIYSQYTATATLNLFYMPVINVKISDINTGYKKFGKGSPLLLIMGYIGSMNSWESIMISKLS
jgi:hypothetical protein